MNIGVLAYFIIHRGLVTDFSEPPNLFALAVNSPPSHVLAGSCGGGPEGKQYMVNWFVNHEGSHLFMEPSEKSSLLAHTESYHGHVHGPVEENYAAPQIAGPHRGAGWFGWVGNAMNSVKSALGIQAKPRRLGSTTATESLRPVPSSRPISMVASEYEMQEGRERTRKQYNMLAQRRSLL